MIGVSRLLKSCATPPVSWPSVSSFCASCSCCDRRLRARRCAPRRAAPGRPPAACSSSSRARASYCRRRAAQRRLRQADQRGRVERPFEEGDVAQHLEIARRGRIALQPAAALGQQDEGKVRPFGLRAEPARPAACRSAVRSASSVTSAEAGARSPARDQLSSERARHAARCRASPSIAARDVRRRGPAAPGSAPVRRDAGSIRLLGHQHAAASPPTSVGHAAQHALETRSAARRA